jgi:DNA-binding transcriptional MocR family regulator
LGLAKKEIPLIEDDIYVELYFSKQRPGSCKRFDKKGLVLYCSSFSKSLAPGYRVGWVIPGKFKKEVIRLKRMNTISTNTLAQSAIAHFLKNGRYELHLRHLRKALHTQSLRYIQAITNHFPVDSCFTPPQGGFVLWIELSQSIDTYKLYKKALKHNIGIAPGKMISSQNRFDNCFRLSYGEPWNDRIERGIRQLGNLIREM